MTPQRTAWLKGRCSQLVAYSDRYGVGRGESSDGPRNHTRIGAAIECERVNCRQGIDTMTASLKRKAFDVLKPGMPAIEPEDPRSPGYHQSDPGTAIRSSAARLSSDRPRSFTQPTTVTR